MPTVFRQEGFDVMIYTLDHEPEHVHVWKAGKEVVINLRNVNQAPYIRTNNGMSNQDKKKGLEDRSSKSGFLVSSMGEISWQHLRQASGLTPKQN
jgi:hypothetical protein